MGKDPDPMAFTSGIVKIEKDWAKLRLAVSRASGISMTELKALPVFEFFILLDELKNG